MFFFLRPKFRISRLPDSKILRCLLFFLFPRCYIVLNENFPELEDSFWDDEFTPEEREAFEEKFCKGTFKARVLTEEEVEQLKREGRI